MSSACKMPVIVSSAPVPSHRAASRALATSVTRRVRSTDSRPTTEVLISSFDRRTSTFRPFMVEGSKVTSSKATSPSVIWPPSPMNPAVRPLTIRGTRTGLDESRMTGPAARNVEACSSGWTSRLATCDWMRVELPEVTSMAIVVVPYVAVSF